MTSPAISRTIRPAPVRKSITVKADAAFAFEVFRHLAKTLGHVGGGLFLLECPGAEDGGGA